MEIEEVHEIRESHIWNSFSWAIIQIAKLEKYDESCELHRNELVNERLNLQSSPS